MKLNRSTIEKFKKIYFEKEGEKLSDEKAFELATNLLLMFDAIYRPIPLDDAKQSVRLKSGNEKNEPTNNSNDSN